MMLQRAIYLLLILMLPTASVLSQPDQHDIIAVDTAFSQMSVEQGRKAAYAHYLSETAVSLENGDEALHGKDAILLSFDPAPGLPPVTAVWQPLGGMVAASGDLAYTWGTYTAQFQDASGAQVTSYGKYTSVWVMENGGWKLAVDISNDSPEPTLE